MRSLELLRAPLAPSDAPELDAVDPRYMEIADMAHRSEFAKLAERVETLLDNGSYDVRLMGFYLFSHFAAGGPSSLEPIFGALLSMLEVSWEALSPKRKREVHVDKCVTWLCQEILDSVAYHQGKRSEVWQRWNQGVEAEGVAKAIEHVGKLYARLDSPSYAGSEQSLSRLLRWTRDYHATLAAKQDGRMDQQQEQDQESPVEAGATFPPGSVRPPSLVAGQVLRLQVSPHFVELDRKLKAFSQLIEQGAYERAALVSDDVLELVENFDPRRYFPELFAVFSRLMSDHVEALEQHWDKRESVQWKTLKQFYQVDLEAFSGSK